MLVLVARVVNVHNIKDDDTAVVNAVTSGINPIVPEHSRGALWIR